MPPHCDTRDGPVVRACMKALETGDVKHALIWVPPSTEPELISAFDRAVRARACGEEAREVADDWFYETAVRLHRAGEGEPFTGLKPAGLDEGPVVPRAEVAIATGDPLDLIGFVLAAVDEDLRRRFDRVMATRRFDPADVTAGRAFVQAYLRLVPFAHHLYLTVTSGEEHGMAGLHGRGSNE